MYSEIEKSFRQEKKQLVVLIDPEKILNLPKICAAINKSKVDYVFVGGSLVSQNIDTVVFTIKQRCDVPVILFPGSLLQISNKADGVLLLSLISGRNPEYLIGHHVLSANLLKKSGLQIVPTAYMLIDGGSCTSVEYISNTRPIPANKIDIAVSTALAGEMLGLRQVYLEAGSGAKNPVPCELISEVRKNISIPIIVGGGLRTPQAVEKVCKAGANIVVVGNIVESNYQLINELAAAVHQCNG